MKRKFTAAEIEAIKVKETLSVAEAALVAGISTDTLYTQWKQGCGPQSFKIGKARRVRRRDLDAWMTSLSKR